MFGKYLAVKLRKNTTFFSLLQLLLAYWRLICKKLAKVKAVLLEIAW